MKKMLKAAAVLAAMVMALTLGACSNDDDGGSGGGSGSGNTPNTPNDPNTPSNENPFGFTKEDSNNYFCLDKDGIVLQKVSGSSEAKKVEGTVFLVYWTLTDGRGNVRLNKYYGDDEDVTIPDGVTEIGSSAFNGCTSLASVTIPDSATKIGWEAFSGCSSLESVTIPGSVTEIGRYAFQDCTSLESVTISDGVTTIGQYAFYGCTSLASVTIPGSVTKISLYAFYERLNIETVNYTGTLKQWCEMDNDLHLMMKVKNIKMPDGTNLKTETQLVIPEGATKIGVYAFYGCTSLESVTIPGSVTEIGGVAFSGCTSLASVTISDGVTSISSYAFNGCSSLASVSIPASVTSIAEYAFQSCGQKNAFEVSFTVQNGWYANAYTSSLSHYDSYQIDVSDPSKNGEYLRSDSILPTTDGTDWCVRGIYRETE